MKNFKKLTALALSAALALGLTACGGDETTNNNTEKDTYKVGVIQYIENGAFNDMREGFIEQMRTLGYDEATMEIVYQNAQADATNLNTICQNMADGTYDAICTIATPATQGMVNLESETPVFFISVSDPVTAGILSDMEKPDKNATGTSNAIPVSDIFALSDQLTPGCETYGLLYCTSEVNSVSTVNAAKEYLDANNLSYVEAVVTNSSEVQQAAQSLVGRVDAIFIPNDSVIQSGMSLVTEVARENKIPVYGSSATMVDSGCFATIAISDKHIGAMTADMLDQYLKGTAVADIPSIVVPADSTTINEDTLAALGVELSDEVKESAVFVKDAQ